MFWPDKTTLSHEINFSEHAMRQMYKHALNKQCMNNSAFMTKSDMQI